MHNDGQSARPQLELSCDILVRQQDHLQNDACDKHAPNARQQRKAGSNVRRRGDQTCQAIMWTLLMQASVLGKLRGDVFSSFFFNPTWTPAHEPLQLAQIMHVVYHRHISKRLPIIPFCPIICYRKSANFGQSLVRAKMQAGQPHPAPPEG